VANKDELIDYAIRAGAPLEVDLQSIEDEGEIYESMEEICGLPYRRRLSLE
jgi:hypothetical protein